MNKLVYNLFEYFYQKSIQKDYRFNSSTIIEKSLSNFLEEVERQEVTIGFNFLWYYFQYYFSRWDFINHKPKLNQLISKQSFLNWQKRNKEFDWVDFDIVEKFSISKKEFLSLYPQEDETIYIKNNPLSIVEESKKKLFLNQEGGYKFCLTETTLFHPKSVSCIVCKFKKTCKDTLERNYKSLYQSRF